MAGTRQHPRFPVEVRVSVRSPDGSHQGRTENLSRGGLCLELSKPIPLGQEVLCDLALPGMGDASEMQLTIAARIVWCTRINEEWQLGMQWGPMDRELASRLEQFLKAKNRPLPS